VSTAPCTWRRGARVSWLNLKTKVDSLSVVWPQNHWVGFSSVWASKPMVTVCEWFGPQKHLDGFRCFGLKTYCDGFLQFGLKTGGDGFSPLGLKPDGGFPG
jgi:hypothetical protein